VVEPGTDHLDPRPHDFDAASRNGVSAERAIVTAIEVVAALDARVRLGPEVVLALNAHVVVVVVALRALRNPTLRMPALIVRTLLGMSLVLMSATLVSVAICCLCNRSGQTQRECQSQNWNNGFA
jgi:hypothetical protein